MFEETFQFLPFSREKMDIKMACINAVFMFTFWNLEFRFNVNKQLTLFHSGNWWNDFIYHIIKKRYTVQYRVFLTSGMNSSQYCTILSWQSMSSSMYWIMEVLKSLDGNITTPQPPTLKTIYVFEVPSSCWFWKCT